ncbi:MAG: bifunctional DNA-formamidopyrimidine glycosylase/DNA-(apurinic or apyrimidinic site) lyase [Frankiales bacterium]|nr:bifunctional DNA-formamidopyrimidine glycosylase/DNA-(apurinic or apyrimidinic site) lyase [Frankiales bacterium]
MPELPEVETVRVGLQRWAVGRTIRSVDLHGPRTVRRHAGGPGDFAARVTGRRIESAARRGKYLWLPLDSGEAVVAHLGMSGQFLAVAPDVADQPHLRARFRFADGPPELRFVDQRTFGGLLVDELTSGGGSPVPVSVAHIALDPIDPAFDRNGFAAALRRRHTGIKRALLDQTLISGVGNIYADEALWRARLHYDRATDSLRRADVERLLDAVDEVLRAAIRAGGTSFDALYVAVNGESGWFDRSLEVYGREGEPCSRCGAAIRREPFMNRSSFRCPRCQRAPAGRRPSAR